MVIETQITFKLSNEEKELIFKACKLLGVGYSPFIKMTCLEKSRKVVQEFSNTSADTNK